jgi:hypothetical protein
MKLVSRILSLGFIAGLGLSATACDEYKYFDVHVRFDKATLPTTVYTDFQFCRVTVSGADSRDFRIGNCPPSTTALGDAGIFTYSTFADSGQLTFKLDAFTSQNENRPECINGTGMVTVSVNATQTAPAELLVTKVGGPSCQSVTPPGP